MHAPAGPQWRAIGSLDPHRLEETRLQAHWAVQLASAFADAALERLPDDSQSNLGWRDDLDLLMSRPRPDGLSAGVRLPDLELMLFDGAGGVIDSLPLAGRSIEQGLAWLGESAGGAAIELRDYEMPGHPVAEGAPFSLEPEACFAELAGWFANGRAALEGLVAGRPGWSEVRCWPHHFDLGTLVSLEPSGDPSSGRSIGAGMSPGDDWYGEPYLYVNPYGLAPRPEPLPDLLPPGHWHTDDWLGAVVSASELLATGDPAERAAAFLEAAVHVQHDLLAT